MNALDLCRSSGKVDQSGDGANKNTNAKPDGNPQQHRRQPATCLVELVDRQLADFVDIANNCTGHFSHSFITGFHWPPRPVVKVNLLAVCFCTMSLCERASNSCFERRRFRKFGWQNKGPGKSNLLSPHLEWPAHRSVRRLLRLVPPGRGHGVEPATCLVELVEGQFANFVVIARNCTSHISHSFILVPTGRDGLW